MDIRTLRHPVHPINSWQRKGMLSASSRHDCAFSRRELPEPCCTRRAPCKQRARGRPGAGWRPRSVRWKRARGGPQAKPEHPGLPCAAGFNGVLRALPGETGSIAPVALPMTDATIRSGACITARLDASVGRQDHTTSPSADGPTGYSRTGVRSPARPMRPLLQRRVDPARLVGAHGISALRLTSRADAAASTAPRPAHRDDRETPLLAG